MKATTEKTIKLKDGNTLPAGLPVTFQQDKPWLCLVQGERAEPFKVRVSSAFAPPCRDELEEAVSDGLCASVLGNSVEPDGWDSDGSPSWPLALGMI